MTRGSQHDVLARRQRGEQAHSLEGPGDPHLGQVVGLHVAQPVALVLHLAGVRLHEARHDVEDGRLPRTVGTDKAGDRTLRNSDTDVVENLQSPEGDADVDRLKQRMGQWKVVLHIFPPLASSGLGY